METDYTKVIPTTPPDGTLEYLIREKAFQEDYLVYRVEFYQNPLTGLKEKGVRVICSACGENAICEFIPADGCSHSYVPAPFGFRKPADNEWCISGYTTLCPWCGAYVTAKHIGQMSKGYCLEEKRCLTVGRYKDKLVLSGWLFQRQVDKNGAVKFVDLPYEAYIVEERKIIRMTAYRKYLTSISLLGQWEQRKQYRDTWLNARYILPWDPEILIGSTAENSKLDGYLRGCGARGRYPVSYLKLWKKHPQVENLVYRGADRVVASAIAEEINRWRYAGGEVKMDCVDWKKRRPAQMLGLNKDEFKVCCDEQWSVEELELYKAARSQEKISLPQDMRVLLLKIKNARRLVANEEIRGGFSIMRCARYLSKQKQSDVTILEDYWKMAAEVEWDLTQASVRLPKDLMAEHNRVMDARQAKRDKLTAEKLAKEIESRKKGFEKMYKKLLPFAWDSGDILIRPVKDEKELIAEGRALSHCVSRYAQSVADGETSIFFIRKKNEPEKPWYTLELNFKEFRVIQNRGKCNCERTEEVKRFEKKWIEWLGSQKKNKKERKTA